MEDKIYFIKKKLRNCSVEPRNIYEYVDNAKDVMISVRNKFDERKYDDNYWGNTYCNHKIFVDGAEHVQEDWLTISLREEIYASNCIFWWSDVTIFEELHSYADYHQFSNSNLKWCYFRKRFAETNINDVNNYFSLEDLNDILKSTGIHFVNSSQHAIPVVFPILNDKDIENITFDVMLELTI
jgi:hypothetical protein